VNLADAFDKLIVNEGDKLSLDPNDSGNWTGGHVGVGRLVGSKYGVSAAAYPTLDIANLTAAQAMGIYQTDYWNPVWGDQLPDVIAFEVFDEAVNMGVHGAIKVLQGALGVPVDGIMGPATYAALNSAPQTKLALRLSASRLEFYTGCAAWPTQGKGWVRRVAANLRML
jgi:lysozyme family protein